MNKKYEIKADELHIGEGIRIGNEVSISGGFDYTTGLNILYRYFGHRSKWYKFWPTLWLPLTKLIFVCSWAGFLQPH